MKELNIKNSSYEFQFFIWFLFWLVGFLFLKFSNLTFLNYFSTNIDLILDASYSYWSFTDYVSIGFFFITFPIFVGFVIFFVIIFAIIIIVTICNYFSKLETKEDVIKKYGEPFFQKDNTYYFNSIISGKMIVYTFDENTGRNYSMILDRPKDFLDNVDPKIKMMY